MLKVNNNKYGISYQGSKTKLIGEISRYFPKAYNFYDLFGGGFSVTHFMLETYSNNFQKFHFNEIRPGVCDLIKDAIDGKYNYAVFKPEWISREQFMADKESNAYIKILWSFGNNGEDYIFGKEIEQQKRSMHQAIIFDEFDDFMRETFGIIKWPNNISIYGKRMLLKSIQRKEKKRVDLERLQQLQQLEQLERLEQLEQLQRLEFTSLDYKDVKINHNSVIYCDIPYKGTSGYGSLFSHEEFFNWAAAQLNPVFISEYKINDDRFKLVTSIKHRTTFSAEKSNQELFERLYCNDVAYNMLKKKSP